MSQMQESEDDDDNSVISQACSSLDELCDDDPDFEVSRVGEQPSPQKGRRRGNKRKYTAFQPPPTDIKTRGVKLTSYSHVVYEQRKRKFEEDAEVAAALKKVEIAVRKEAMLPAKMQQGSPIKPPARRGRPPKNKVTPYRL